MEQKNPIWNFKSIDIGIFEEWLELIDLQHISSKISGFIVIDNNYRLIFPN
jgi:hypothetical protein